MSQTTILFGDPKAQKKWSGKLFIDTAKKSYFTRKFIGDGENAVIQRKTELDSDQGDRISFDLSVQLRGKPVRGDNRAKGTEENLKFYTDEVIIDQIRHPVSCGGRMTRKRTAHDLRMVAKDRLSDYWSQYIDELHFIYLSGARGINQDFIEDTDFEGHAGNPIQAPDQYHIMFGGSATSKASLTADDKMTRGLIEKAGAVAKMMRALDPKTANLLPVTVEGEPHYITLMNPHQEYDLRAEAGEKGWLEVQKAAAAAVGKSSPIICSCNIQSLTVVNHS